MAKENEKKANPIAVFLGLIVIVLLCIGVFLSILYGAGLIIVWGFKNAWWLILLGIGGLLLLYRKKD